MPRPAGLCLDAYGTMVALDRPVQRLVASFAEHGVTVSEDLAAEALAAEVAWYRPRSLTACDAASLAELRRQCARIIGDVVGRVVPFDLTDSQLVSVLMSGIDVRPLPGVPEALAMLRGEGLRLAVVSNWDCSLRDWLDRSDLTRWFDAIVVSAEVGVEKPDPAIWEPALAALGLPRELVWHVGDEPEADGLGAQAAGLVPVLVGDAVWPPGGQTASSLHALAMELTGRATGVTR